MPPPPPPPPPPPSGPPPPPSRSGFGAKSSNNAKPADRNALLGQIQKGTKLKKTVTNDRSAPLVGNNKNSSAKKYNTIGVHTHRQQPHHPQPPGPALWRRGSQDGNKQSSGPMNSRGPGSPGGPSPMSKSCGGGIGELFPGGVPKLPKGGLKQRSPANLSPKPIRSVKNGPTTQGERTPPPNRNVQNGVEINRVMSAKPSLANRPKPPPAPPTTPPTGINNNINVTNNNNNNNLNFSQTHTSGGLPLNMSRRMPGSQPPPPPPPSRPPALPSNRPTAPKNRPNSMIGRPLPPTPTSSSSSSSSSSLNRNLPPLPSNKAPQPPERTVSTGGSLPRTRAPSHKPPPPQRPPPGQRPPPPPPARPPSGPAQPLLIHDGPVPPQRSSSNCSIGSLDLEKRGHFHSVHEFPPAEPFTGCPKTYPSQSAKNLANRRAPPPPPPPTGVSIAR